MLGRKLLESATNMKSHKMMFHKYLVYFNIKVILRGILIIIFLIEKSLTDFYDIKVHRRFWQISTLKQI